MPRRHCSAPGLREEVTVGPHASLPEREHVVDHDLDSRRSKVVVHGLRRPARTASVRVHDETHLDAAADSFLERRSELLPDLPRSEAELHHVDRAASRSDIVEHAGEEAPAFRPGLDSGGGGPRELRPQVGHRDIVAAHEVRRGLESAVCGYGRRRGRPARRLGHAQHAPPQCREDPRDEQGEQSPPVPSPEAVDALEAASVHAMDLLASAQS